MNSSEQISGIPEDEIFGIIGVPLGLDQNVVWILHTDPAHVLPLLHGISYVLAEAETKPPYRMQACRPGNSCYRVTCFTSRFCRPPLPKRNSRPQTEAAHR
jgi:hypothetical protein